MTVSSGSKNNQSGLTSGKQHEAPQLGQKEQHRKAVTDENEKERDKERDREKDTEREREKDKEKEKAKDDRPKSDVPRTGAVDTHCENPTESPNCEQKELKSSEAEVDSVVDSGGNLDMNHITRNTKFNQRQERMESRDEELMDTREGNLIDGLFVLH